MPQTPATWHPMQPSHLPAVHALAKRVHTAYPERPEIAAERLRLAPGWCRVLVGEGDVVGYILAHPWRLGAPPALDMLVQALPPQPDTLYLHDIVIEPARRGRGEARRGLAAFFAEAESFFPSVSLISIGALTSFWKDWGFEVRNSPALPTILSSYDAYARYMVKAFRSGPT
jgi:GNAT superfamily N-acetyltransferase